MLFIVLHLARCRYFWFQMFSISEKISNKQTLPSIVVSRETECDVVMR